MALVGELHGVGNEIHENLLQPRAVPEDEPWECRVDVHGERHPFFVRLRGQQTHAVADHLLQAQRLPFQFHLA